MAKQVLESFVGISLVAASMMTFSSPAEAAVIQFDDQSINGGTLSYDGEDGPLIGTNLLLDLVMGIDTPLNSGTGGSLLCEGCQLNLMTGANLSESPYQFAPGGSVTITGTVKNGDTEIATGTLVSGSFTENITGSVNNFVVVFTGIGFDTIDPGISSFFGIDTTEFEFAQTSIAIGDVDILSNGGFTGVVTNVDMDNIPRDTEDNLPEDNIPGSVSVPEPATLLGIGVVSAALAISRRR